MCSGCFFKESTFKISCSDCWRWHRDRSRVLVHICRSLQMLSFQIFQLKTIIDLSMPLYDNENKDSNRLNRLRQQVTDHFHMWKEPHKTQSVNFPLFSFLPLNCIVGKRYSSTQIALTCGETKEDGRPIVLLLNAY